jgi:hypothetical protein
MTIVAVCMACASASLNDSNAGETLMLWSEGFSLLGAWGSDGEGTCQQAGRDLGRRQNFFYFFVI